MPLPDEGVIHAWLDGQLPPDEAARIEQLVATDSEWAAAAAEARGLVAASSRILSALDQVPAGVVPKRTTLPVGRRLPWWTKAAAAVVLVVGASVVVRERAPSPDVVNTPTPRDASSTVKAPPSIASPVAPAAQPRANVSARVAGKDNAQRGGASATGREEKTTAPAAQLAVAGAAVAESRAQVEPVRAPVDLPQPVATQSAQQGRGDATQMARDAQHRETANVMAQRTSVETRAAKAFTAPAPAVAPAAAPRPALEMVGGVAAIDRQASANVIGTCYRLRDSRTAAAVATVMRVVRTEGDTLRLEPAQTPSPLRAWVVWRDGAGHGVLTTAPDGRGMVLVTAAFVACPSP